MRGWLDGEVPLLVLRLIGGWVGRTPSSFRFHLLLLQPRFCEGWEGREGGEVGEEYWTAKDIAKPY